VSTAGKRLLVYSDIHRDLGAARSLVARAAEADVLVCAGDLGVMRRGLAETVAVLSETSTPTVLVAGNAESDAELAAACAAWPAAHVLHGSGAEVEGVSFWGLGGGIPVTPFGSWSFDISEEDAAPLLEGCPEGGVLVTHSPPYGHVDSPSPGDHLGSRAILQAIERARPALVVCGHIHAQWGGRSRLGETRILNAGPQGVWVTL
jgi:Icc-related predicted phosphoesterase